MSLISMTGFGRASIQHTEPESGREITIEVEARSVNHRFLDLNWRLPLAYSRFETQLAPLVREFARRGRIDVSVVRKVDSAQSSDIAINESVFISAVEKMRSALERAGLNSTGIWERSVAGLFDRREVLDLSTGEFDPTSELQPLQNAVRSALEELSRMRIVEGEALSQQILGQVEELRILRIALKDESQTVVDDQQQRLRERIEKLLSQHPDAGAIDEGRLLQEIVYLADRSDITEELDRLEAHLTALESAVRSGDGAKKVEFLLQEIGREVNTSGSKSQRSSMTASVVQMKVILEKIREQTLNLE